jgi:hypothetical protein
LGPRLPAATEEAAARSRISRRRSPGFAGS